MNYKLILYIVWILFLATGLDAYSQQDLTKEVKVVKPYEPTISDANKISYLPKISDTVKVIPQVNYLLQTKPVNVGYTIEPIKAARMVSEPLTKLYQSYLKVGVGTKTLPLLEAYINSKRSEDYSLGAYYKYDASYAKVTLLNDDRVFAGYSDNDLQLFGKKFFKNSTLQGDIGVKGDTRYFYGFDTQVDTSMEKEEIKQKYLQFNVNTSYKSTHVDSNHINYDFRVGLDYVKDDYSNHELGFKIKGDVHKIFAREMVGVQLGVEHYSVSENVDSSNNTIVEIKPWVGKFGDKWRVKAGINIYSDIREDNTNTFYYPVGLLEYDVANHFLIPYAGVDGKTEVNSFLKTITRNPFIVPGTGMLNTDHKLILYGGLRGNFNSSTYYNFKVSYSLIDNMPFYINNLALTDSTGNQFSVVYDNIELVHYFGELSLAPSEKLNLHVKANYREYKMDSELKPWHKPAFDLTFSARYNLRDKIILKGDVFTLGKRYAKLSDQGDFAELESVIDINIGAEYRYSKILSGFIQLNNILSEKYYEWNYYPSYGFNVLLGVTYAL
ncbi:MAG: hypothetical protein V2I54_11495 [Bacteroidales bacterium]|jgi:hypothetical protein|nr:hypothetical protein [Bacteroidales bacterium]